jgi:DNA-directed RNA polymerase specialized sigma24 family protein
MDVTTDQQTVSSVIEMGGGMELVQATVDVPARCRQYRSYLLRLAVLLVDDQASAEDAVQDTFIALYPFRFSRG